MIKPNKRSILGINFSQITEKETAALLSSHDYGNKEFVCFPSTDTITLGDKDLMLRHIINSAFLTLTDGKMTELLARFRKIQNIKTISGLNILKALLNSDLSHFFYGLNDSDLRVFKSKINEKYPNANVLGFRSPPFLELREIENNKTIYTDIEYIKSLGPDLIWLGISTPKQEYLAYHYLPNLNRGVFVCVGAVFLYMADLIDPGPAWVKKMGVKWLYRLVQEPKRLWKHTFKTSLYFLVLLCKSLISPKNK